MSGRRLDATRTTTGSLVSMLDAACEPENLRHLKNEMSTSWGTVPLIDMLKEAQLRTGSLAAVTSASAAVNMPADVLAQRLLLAIYAYGTNTGIYGRCRECGQRSPPRMTSSGAELAQRGMPRLEDSLSGVSAYPIIALLKQ